MFKTQVERRVVSLKSFEHFMASFLWSIRVYTMENGGHLFFTITFIFTKNQKQNNRHRMSYVISMVYTLIDHSSRPIIVRGFAQLL